MATKVYLRATDGVAEPNSEAIWIHIRSEAADILASDGDLTRLIRRTVIDQPDFDAAVINGIKIFRRIEKQYIR